MSITRRMTDLFDNLDNHFERICSPEDLERGLDRLRAAGRRSGRDSALADLYRLLDCCGASYEMGRENAYYETLAQEQILPDLPHAEEQMIRALYWRFEQYPTPERYMRRIVDRLSSPADAWGEDPLRLRILKQFICYGDYLSAAGYRGKGAIISYLEGKLGHKPSKEEVLRLLDDGIFQQLDRATKAQKKPEGTYGLLKLADDLAKGNFRVGGATKRGLYLFAMVYGMTYYAGGEDERLAYESDLEKNLFQDYYCNNLMRFLSGDYRQHSCEFERDPSGQGINYKNFVEMVYLYYIASDLPAVEKIRHSAAMIERLQQSGDSSPVPPPTDVSRDTGYFKGLFFRTQSGTFLFCEDLLSQPEAQFEEFLRTNYQCGTRKGKHEVGMLQMETEQNTAFRCYQGLMKELRELGGEAEWLRCGLWFADAAALEPLLDRVLAGIEPVEPEKREAFLRMMVEADRFLKQAAEVPDAEHMTRTRLLSAFYCVYNARNEMRQEETPESFRTCFWQFKGQADQLLEACGYQRLSGKSLFDVLVAFSAYAYQKL